MLNNLDLSKLRILKAVSETSSVSKAADALSVTPSSVSQSIRAIEDNLGKQLFMRVGKKLISTPLALALVEKSNQFFSDLEQILKDNEFVEASISVGAPSIFGSSKLISSLDQFRRKFPRVKLSIKLMDTGTLIDQLLNYKFDLVFLDGGLHLNDFSNIATRSCYQEELVLCCSENFFKQNKKSFTKIKDQVRLPHIPYHSGKEGIHKWYQHHYQVFYKHDKNISIDHPIAIVSAIKKDWGLGVVPKSMVELDKKVKIIEGKKGSLMSEIVIGQLLNKVPSTIEKDLIDSVTKFFEN